MRRHLRTRPALGRLDPSLQSRLREVIEALPSPVFSGSPPSPRETARPAPDTERIDDREQAASKGRLVRLYGIQLPDGHIQVLRAAEIPSHGESVSLQEARNLLGLSRRQLSYLCDVGHFQTARKGPGKTSPWTISLTELVQKCRSAKQAANGRAA